MTTDRYRKGSRRHLVTLIHRDRVESLLYQQIIDRKLNLKGEKSPTILSIHGKQVFVNQTF